MELHFTRLAMAVLAVAALSIAPSQAQISTPCNASMIASFRPCMNFVTNSSGNGTSPTQDCCNALRTLTGSGMDCMCLIVTGSVPFQVPINRTLAISLPRACNMTGVPVQCKAAAGAPIPAPGPSFGPSASPSVSPSGSSIPEPISPALSPESDTTPLLTPPAAETPTATAGSRPALTPSATDPTHSLSASVLLFAMGFLVMNEYLY